MVDVICDTSFLIFLATKRIKNISRIDTDIGPLNFLVPSVVEGELERLQTDLTKNKEAQITLNYIKKLKKISILGSFADKAIIDYVKKNGGLVATLDKELKNKIKQSGGSILSVSNDRIVLEPS